MLKQSSHLSLHLENGPSSGPKIMLRRLPGAETAGPGPGELQAAAPGQAAKDR